VRLIFDFWTPTTDSRWLAGYTGGGAAKIRFTSTNNSLTLCEDFVRIVLVGQKS
jgi:hypothetical protein